VLLVVIPHTGVIWKINRAGARPPGASSAGAPSQRFADVPGRIPGRRRGRRGGAAGWAAVTIARLPDSAGRESRDRVWAAIRNVGFEFPIEHITVNPGADLQKVRLSPRAVLG
jgi:hypothetical protein